MAVLTAHRTTHRATQKTLDSETQMLPKEIVIGAVKYAQMVKGTEHMIPNDQILPQIYQELGWE